MNKGINFLLLLLIFILHSCSSVDLNERKEYRKHIAGENYPAATLALEKMDLAKNEKSLLLYLMEKGLLLHLQAKYVESNEVLLKAERKAKELYTTKISAKITKVLSNDQEDVYYGENYEKSLIAFYMALNYFLIYQSSNDIIDLRKARSHLLAWDSLLKTFKSESTGLGIFKDDILAKLVGAQIHMAFNTTEEDNIALNLYKEALEVIFKYYNSYKIFNTNAEKFNKDYKTLAQMPRDIVKQRYISETKEQQELREYIERNIVSLKNKKIDKSNVNILIEYGMIPQKVAKIFDFSLEGALKNSPNDKTKSQAMMIGTHVLSAFMTNILGLYPSSGGEAIAGAASTVVAARYAGVKFELPKMEEVNHKFKIKLEIEKIGNNNSNNITQHNLVLASPMGDIAVQAIDEHSASDYTRVGTRVAMKHLTAILAAYLTYKSISNEFFAKSAALIQYTVSSKAIGETEKADLRFWSSLPQDYRINNLHLDEGEYDFWLNVENITTLSKKKINLGKYTISKDKKNLFIHKRIY